LQKISPVEGVLKLFFAGGPEFEATPLIQVCHICSALYRRRRKQAASVESASAGAITLSPTASASADTNYSPSPSAAVAPRAYETSTGQRSTPVYAKPQKPPPAVPASTDYDRTVIDNDLYKPSD